VHDPDPFEEYADHGDDNTPAIPHAFIPAQRQHTENPSAPLDHAAAGDR
jgi:hypothetical protein